MKTLLHMILAIVFLVGSVFEYTVTGRRMVKNECLCIPRGEIYLYKKIANYTKIQPLLLTFTIPKVKKRFDHIWKNALTDVPKTNPLTFRIIWDKKNRIFKDERHLCTKSIMMGVDNLRFPRTIDYIQCHTTRLGRAGTCRDVREPVVVLRIRNPRQKGRRCRYVPTIEWRVVGCSWLPDEFRRGNEYLHPKRMKE